jgi:hypothetical protein
LFRVHSEFQPRPKKFDGRANPAPAAAAPRGAPRAEKPAPKPAPYPVLEAFKGRKAAQYLDLTRLGAIRDQKEDSR